MKIVIGLTGEKLAGKETFVRCLTQILSESQQYLPLPNRKILASIRSSDVLIEILKSLRMEATRKNMQKLAVVLDKGFGKGTLTRSVQRRIQDMEADIVIFDGVRWQTDALMIREFQRNILVYITADIKTRHQRVQKRKEKIGEDKISFEDFKKEEQAETEIYIPEIGRFANFTVVNNGDEANLKSQVQRFFNKYIVPDIVNRCLKPGK